MAPTEVARHQRLRMHGAMVEAVAANGYAGTSVKQVIGLAGVSRRAFYEQFANKEECFLATFDLIASRWATRVGDAYRATEGDLEGRLRAAMGELTEEIEANDKSAVLAIVETQTAGTPGLARLRRAMGTFERMLATSFERAPDAPDLPTPIVRGIVGGLHEILCTRLRAGAPEEIPALTGELVRWIALFGEAGSEHVYLELSGRLGERLATPRPRSLRIVPSGPTARWAPVPLVRSMTPPTISHATMPATSCSVEDLRGRLRASILNLAVLDDYRELSPPQIAEQAGIPLDSFFDLYESKEACFLAAFDELSEELLQVAADPGLVSGDWAQAVRRVIGELLGLLARHPLYAHVIALEAPSASGEALERDCDLAYDIATLLTEGAPRRACNKLAVEGVAGALWHAIRCQVASGQVHLLPALADHLTYLVLTPFLGAQAAADVVLEAEEEEIAPVALAGIAS